MIAMPTPLSTFLRRMLAATVAAAAIGLVLTASASAASPAWKLLGVTGPTHLAPYSGEQQAVKINATSGTFTLTFDGDTTAALDFEARASDIEAALNALPSISEGGGSVSVHSWAKHLFTPLIPGAVVVSFDGGPLASQDVPALQGAASAGAVTVEPAPAGVVRIEPQSVQHRVDPGRDAVPVLALEPVEIPVVAGERLLGDLVPGFGQGDGLVRQRALEIEQ